ncbi:hypothetical protein HYW46_00640 [Candidatus Daviesbacteria bacterium]|nr:hypothetical protein [Candidatus Daviesbacteria bacterium]
MKSRFKLVRLVAVAAVLVTAVWGCAPAPTPTSDQQQTRQQDKLLEEGTRQTGMPNIVNFRERKMMKDILELRDQEGLVTFTYLENLSPIVVPGKTALGGKLTFLGESVGYGLPYATQYTNPQRVINPYTSAITTLPQADPNGLFSPASAEGTWVILKDPGSNKTGVVYVEPRIVVSPFKYQPD